ncbi:MAG: hypothetical protein OXU81_15260 [Gammaproteobacteria bacterium]|nr:hypothetical protein [Gammaproteobacteria bacterium]
MARRPLAVGCLAGLVLVGIGAGATAAGTNFSQHPGFAEFFAANPPTGVPNESDRALLRRHAPRFHLPAGHEGPIDFYRDYIAHGHLVTGEGVRIEGPTPAELNRHRDDPRAQFVHVPGRETPRPVVYAGVERTDLWAPRRSDSGGEEFTVAVYHLVFRVSGLPAALPGMTETSLGLVADLDDWHQLDHYTAAFVVLDAGERPVALTLQQHNYLRTHLVGESVAPGRNGRFDIDVAVRSNELYPHVPERRRRRAVRFLTPEGAAFMMGYGKRPLMSADDVTDPDRTVAYELAFLPGSDAFYTFEGYLGERRLLPGRDGPPGARYNTLPQLKPLPAQILGGYWRERNEGDWERYRRSRERSADPAEFSRAQGPVFHRNLACLRRGKGDCTLQ